MRGGSTIGPCPSQLDTGHVHINLFKEGNTLMSKYFNMLYYRNINSFINSFRADLDQFYRVQIVKNSADNPDTMTWRPRIESGIGLTS